MEISPTIRPPYVPVIKWQLYERIALGALTAPVAARVLPCLEIRDSAQHDTLLKHLATVWSRPALVDYADPSGTLTTTRESELKAFLEQLTEESCDIIPVFNPADVTRLEAKVIGLMVKRCAKVALRVRLKHYETTSAALSALKSAIAKLGMTNDAIVLLIDLGATPGLNEDQLTTLATFVKDCSALNFASVTLVSGAFPKDLQAIKGSGTISRNDWILWKSVDTLTAGVNLGYGDYGILHPQWSEEQLKRRGGRATIKYALAVAWRIIRGTDKTRAQSIAISQLMTTVYAKEFRKKGYSHGDTMIANRLDPAVPLAKKKSGNAHITEAWTIHITYLVTDQY